MKLIKMYMKKLSGDVCNVENYLHQEGADFVFLAAQN